MHRILLPIILLFGLNTFAQPTITSFTPASGPVGTLVTITGTNLSSPTTFKIGGVTAIAVSNTGTQLVGMVMSGATTGTVTVTTAAGTVTSAGNFTVTATPHPSVQQGSKLVGTGAFSPAQQGSSVSVSSDGNTAIIGGLKDNNNAGAAWVYTRSGGVWTQQGSKLVGTGATGTAAYQGVSVSLSADGNTAIVGGDGDNVNIGAVWIFTRSGGVWTQQGGKLVGTGATGAAEQGWSVSLSGDGNTAIVGGFYDNNGAGAAWIYIRNGGVWTQQGSKLVGTGATGAPANQGTSVSLSADGNTAIIGGQYDNVSAGAAWVYTRSGGVWTQQGNKLVGTGAIFNAEQGASVSLSADGNTAIVGGYGDNSAGAAWLYTRSGGIWTQQGAKLVGTGATGLSYQGWSVSLSADGNTAIVGGYGDNSQAGAAWLYTRSGGIWTQQGSKLIGTGAVGAAEQGYSVSLSADGNTAIVGGYIDNTGAGAAWIYTRSGVVWTQQGSKLVGTGVTSCANQGGSVSISSDGNTAIVGGNNDSSMAGAAWVYTRNGAIWTQQGSKLVGMGATGAAQQGFSVSLSADGNTAIVGGYSDNSNAGAAWVFTRGGGIWTQQGSKLVGMVGSVDAQQGVSVSLSADGNTAVVGGNGDNNGEGAAWVYTRNGGVWTQQGSKLVGTGAIGTSGQGWSVSLSADGNRAIVGGPQDNSGAGAAWVYIRSGGVWTQQGSKLVGTGAIGVANQGISVSLSADGNTAIVGGFEDNNYAGAAWIYTRNGGVWTQQGGKLVGTGATGAASQGASVSLSGDGNTVIVGSLYDNNSAGAAWVYTRNGGVWTQRGSKLVGTGAIGAASQGVSVSLSADAKTAIVGGYINNNGEGAAWIFTQCDPSYWIGAVSDVWENPANWSCGIVPDGNTNIIVNPGTPFSPVIRSNATCRTITVDPGATLTVAPGYTLTIIGP